MAQNSEAAPYRNRLADETSPYLLQHADNPVDWYPWGEEALTRAREEGKPIFLSIGYSACHWCHVMAHESFENPDTAKVMNEHFINIKVDREERPDLDQIYQAAYQLLAGRGGGWPLSMFLTPDLGPFWGGTYFPGEPRYGMPAFGDVLLGVVSHYKDKPEDVQHNVNALVQGLARMNHTQTTDRALSDNLLEASAQALLKDFDPIWGGFGEAPKFPSTMSMALLLKRWYRTGNQAYRHAVTHTLTKMAEGGIRDHLGGGFARYSVDEKWLVPHFEKMLYDNSQLVSLYIDAHLATGETLFADVARQTLDYVMREMTAPEGGFYAAQDADSEGEEGRFFVWRPGEIEELLGAADGALFCAYYGVTDVGNFEGQSILWTPEPLDEVATDFGKTPEEAEKVLAAGRKVLLAERAKRVWPGRDDKVITAWNGLMLSAFAKAYSVFGDENYLDTARRAAAFLTGTLLGEDGLKRCYKDGRARFAAYLDDYAFLAQGLLDLYHAVGDVQYLNTAQALMDQVQARFAAPKGGFYFTADDHEEMITRSFSGQDQSVPSGNAVVADVLARLHHLTGETGYLDAAEATVRNFLDPAAMSAQGYGQMLLAVDRLIHPPTTVAVVGAADDAEADRWRASLVTRYLPDAFIQRVLDGKDNTHGASWLAGKVALEGHATAYLCRAGTCAAPITDWESLDAALGAADNR